MFIGPGLLLSVLLFVVGFYWCYEVIGRLDKDFAELRQRGDSMEDKVRKGTIIFIWAVTIIIGTALVITAASVGWRIVLSVYDVFTAS
jgi:hypothetical protein